MQIIPAIDIIGGNCVRLTRGDFGQKKLYNENPLEVARQFGQAGIKRLHLVDLDGARDGKVKNWQVLESIASNTSLKIDFGGGIKTEEDVELVLKSGASLVTVGTIAIKNKALFSQWLEKFGVDKFLLGADVKDRNIVVKGWTETTNIDIDNFIRDYLSLGVTQIFCTDVSRDGMLEGPSFNLYKNLIDAFPTLQLIASGGIASVDDLEQLQRIGCRGAIVGKAFYEGKINLQDIQPFL